ncbi:hypothetical protein Sinac_0197 [Singulisphaera acidiphila DSM 18658]|uniref:Uncharacterized protein n=1 Tax=Singulisphaera acidiphila (strain ATCC BAA-1392 / DSM 18658 / VKM B-2454 / MOB10) TaxID=886293 RepID=L0D737_SINAD|nr:hypothetical protein Sinac_0197 [Singulisphaera acidiphila DSM 18658]
MPAFDFIWIFCRFILNGTIVAGRVLKPIISGNPHSRRLRVRIVWPSGGG